jgi:hypothetical protein
MIAIGIWAVLSKHSLLSGSNAHSPIAAVVAKAEQVPKVATQDTLAENAKVWDRPSASVAARTSRRSGFAWILRQLGATEEQLNRLADLDIAGVILELKQKARAGDAASINILGEIAYQNCELGRDDATMERFAASQIRDVQAVPGIDPSWFTAVIREDEAFNNKVHAACAEVNVDDALSSVNEQADKGDGASLWLMFRASNHMTEMQQRLRDAAAAGFPQAQFELAWAILGGQEGAAGTGSSKITAGDMLRNSAEQLPRSESQLAICEYSGCDGVTVDVDAAIKHAREAAQRGTIDGVLAIGPRLPAGQIDPNEVAAWSLVQASLQQDGCGTGGFSVRDMKRISSTLNANNISAQARALAQQYWQDYGAQMMTNLGCTS